MRDLSVVRCACETPTRRCSIVDVEGGEQSFGLM